MKKRVSLNNILWLYYTISKCGTHNTTRELVAEAKRIRKEVR